MHAIRWTGDAVPAVPTVLAAIRQAETASGTSIQAVDADCVYDERHLASAIMHAERAWRQGRASGHSLSSELLLYLTGERQVRRALALAGLREGATGAVFVAFGPGADNALDGLLRVLGLAATGPSTRPAALARMGVPDGWALLERVALVDLRK